MKNIAFIIIIVLFITNFISCSPDPYNPDLADSLVVNKYVVSLKPDESETINVYSFDINGYYDKISIETDSEDYIDYSSTKDEIKVTGKSIGDTVLTIENESGKKLDIIVRTIDPFTLHYKGLLIKYVDQFTYEWHDSGSGGDHDGSFYTPIAPEGYYPVGSIGNWGYSNPNNQLYSIVVSEVPGTNAIAHPEDYQWVWDDSGSGADNDGSFWRPIPPAGYKALGLVAKQGNSNTEKPPLTKIVCIREDLVVHGVTGTFLWNDSDTGSDDDGGFWMVNCPIDSNLLEGYTYLYARTFIGHASHSTPADDPAANVLKVKVPVMYDYDNGSFRPRLESHDTPNSETESKMNKLVLVPFDMIVDNTYTLHEKIINSPFYMIEREEYYKHLVHEHNDTSDTQSFEHTYTVGFSQSESQTYSETYGIEITTEAGIELDCGFSSSISVTLSYEFGFENTQEFEIFSETSVTKTVNIPPQKSASLWQLYNRFILKRNTNNGWVTVVNNQNPWSIGIDSFVVSEYPRN
jgi:hypothetical protein